MKESPHYYGHTLLIVKTSHFNSYILQKLIYLYADVKAGKNL